MYHAASECAGFIGRVSFSKVQILMPACFKMICSPKSFQNDIQRTPNMEGANTWSDESTRIRNAPEHIAFLGSAVCNLQSVAPYNGSPAGSIAILVARNNPFLCINVPLLQYCTRHGSKITGTCLSFSQNRMAEDLVPVKLFCLHCEDSTMVVGNN